MANILRGLSVVLFCLGAAWLLWPRGAPDRTTIVGDGAITLRAALDLPEGRHVDAVLLRRARRLRHLPDVARICRGRCGPGLTVLRVPGPGGGTRLVFEMSGLDGIDALDRGAALPRDIVTCLVEAVRTEVSGGAARGPCATPRRVVRALPYGL